MASGKIVSKKVGREWKTTLRLVVKYIERDGVKTKAITGYDTDLAEFHADQNA